MENLKDIQKKALHGEDKAQKLLGDIYSGQVAGYADINLSYAAHWYKAAFVNKNKEALNSLRKLSETGNEAVNSALLNILLNGDLNREGRNIDEAISFMQKLSLKNTGNELSPAFTDSFRMLASDFPDIPLFFEKAHSISDSDKKNYALIFRPDEAKLQNPIPLNSYLQYTVEVEKEMLRREGKNAEIIAPETEGGWGYSEKEAVVVKTDGIPDREKEIFVIKCERPIAAKILFRHALDLGLSNIHFEEEGQKMTFGSNKRKYDVLEYHVSGIPLPVLPALRKHFEKAEKEKDEKAMEMNIYLHKTMMIIYHIKYWFMLPGHK